MSVRRSTQRVRSHQAIPNPSGTLDSFAQGQARQKMRSKTRVQLLRYSDMPDRQEKTQPSKCNHKTMITSSSNRFHETQALSMYALISSESTHVTVMAVMPSGAVECAAEEEPLPEPLLVEPLVAFEAPILVDGVPEEPPAKLESCAKPTAGGLERKTEYTFLRKVSPTIQSGVPDEGLTLEPAVISKMAPRQAPLLTVLNFMSESLIGHAGPPNDIAMFSLALHGKE